VGYNPYRGTFEVEWDDEAEVVLAQLAFEEGESAEETQLKLKMIEIYNTKLDERQASIDITDPHILFPKNHSIRFDSATALDHALVTLLPSSFPLPPRPGRSLSCSVASWIRNACRPLIDGEPRKKRI